MSSLISRDSMLLIAGCPETSYPWLRVHILRFAPRLLFLVFWTWCSLLCSAAK